MSATAAPQNVLDELSVRAWMAQAVAVAARLGIAELLRNGARPAGELARETGANEDALYRLLRALAGAGLFEQRRDRLFALTPEGERLLPDHPETVRPFALFAGSAIRWRSWGELLHAVRSGEPAFMKAFGTELFDYLGDDPESAAIFNDAMTRISWGVGTALAAVAGLSNGDTVVDVGGGHGRLLIELLEAVPGARGIVFDLPRVVAGAGAAIEGAGLSGRCETVAGSFFEAVPPGDVIVARHIVHDWDDDRAATILGRMRDGAAAGGRVLLVEAVVEEGAGFTFTTWLDLEMLVLTSGGRERTESEFRDLLAGAGLTLTRLLPMPEVRSFAIEAVPA